MRARELPPSLLMPANLKEHRVPNRGSRDNNEEPISDSSLRDQIHLQCNR